MATSRCAVALDWTPNSNHAGFYVARAKGWYTEPVEIVSPHGDDYKTTPAQRVCAAPEGHLCFGITPSESVISYHTHPDPTKPKLVAVAACLQDSTSAIVTLKSSGIDRPSALDGAKYASYGARYEGRIVQQLIKNDGGRGEFVETTPPMLGIWETLLKGQADATWVFLGWEGVEAELKGVELNVFKLEDYKVPYGYSPLVVANADVIKSQPERVRAFLDATARGYAFAAQHPQETASIMYKAVLEDTAQNPLPTPLDLNMLTKAQEYTASHYLTPEGKWGLQLESVWDKFIDFLHTNGLLTSKIQSREQTSESTATLDGLRQGDVGAALERSAVQSTHLFTNDFLPA
mmetsp:Transcript_19098/g.32768  ORF Transcript_19098/g.32768 Transcript_19098/m.32768 type:complete len:348 (-) Transcript_19098:373-1416(-)|eukprot:CAMPEP_0119101648 /NCGR_PEP_ID=MMETSP1180-20130426/642_1 /TAXON_ID=3052 ORGANISM="Chlamydomonas cf sp, Strain CCMP681" /NCGR_SAMPLE_ID=MMETSP1180 /ASSEMBLY_ACC=CAM_ASM_000741 /LENGTH=347 /DNA_ID=CAMNT_0007085799 /DNA_START=36 /DNA_END=1079 /DNA_ORIENTATION=+